MMRPSRWTAVASAAALIALGACSPRAAEGGADQQPATQPVDLQIDPSELAQTQGISVGDPNAPVVIYEFADFQCPACAQFASFGTPYIKQRHVEAGTVRYVHFDFPLIRIHPHAFLAARAARCANDQGHFWAYHDLLYAEQQAWSGEQTVLPRFVAYAEQVGADRQTFEACLRSDRHAEEVTRNLRLGESLGVPGTPTLFINGRRAEIRSLEDLDQLIAQEAGTPPAAPAGAS